MFLLLLRILTSALSRTSHQLLGRTHFKAETEQGSHQAHEQKPSDTFAFYKLKLKGRLVCD